MFNYVLLQVLLGCCPDGFDAKIDDLLSHKDLQTALINNSKYEQIGPLACALLVAVKALKDKKVRYVDAMTLKKGEQVAALGCNVVAATYALCSIMDLARMPRLKPRALAVERLEKELASKSAAVGRGLQEAMMRLKTAAGPEEIQSLLI